MFTTFRKFIELLTPLERWRLTALTFVFIATGISQVVGIGSIIPVLGLFTKPEAVEENELLRWAFTTLGFSGRQEFMLFVGFFALAALALSNALSAFTLWLTTRFAWSVQARLSISLLRSYLSQPYVNFLDRNSADKGKNVLYEVERFTRGILHPMLLVVAFVVITLAITGFLFWFNPLLAALATATIGGSYVLILIATRRTLLKLGQTRLYANTERFKMVNEAFGGIKEVKVLGGEEVFVQRLVAPARRFAQAAASEAVVGSLPRYIIETVIFGIILAAALLLLVTGAGAGEIMNTIAVFAFAGYRLLPAIQQVYANWTTMRFYQPVVDTIYQDMQELSQRSHSHKLMPSKESIPTVYQRCKDGSKRERLAFERCLELKNITFTYPNALKPAVSNVSLIIPRGSFIAFVGHTGEGKTTLVDIILGLLQPQQGEIRVDDVLLEDEATIRAWQQNIGYVPQEIYLSDDTVAANIAFTVPPEQRDQDMIERAARIANIHDFIVRELPNGYDTMVGERGVRLSGGQRQRIGIARALYRQPEVLVLDEATSNLDLATEAAVHEAIKRIAPAKTVIMIAHRLSITRHCDIIYLLDRGRLVGQGSYDELVASNNHFRKLAMRSR